VEVYLYALLTSAVGGGERSASRPSRFVHGERAPGLYPLDGRVGGLQNLPGSGGQEKSTLPPLGFETHRSESHVKLNGIENPVGLR
jgi:hypothetical protein